MSGADPEALRAEALRCVEDDLDMIAAAVERGRYRPAAFHAQRSVEKLLKVLLILDGQRVPKMHDLESLIRQAGVSADLPGDTAEQLAALTSWVTIGRYPELEEDIAPTPEDIEEARQRLQLLERLVRARLAGT